MSKMLSCDVDRHFDVKFELHHFERCRMPMAEEVADESESG